MTPSASYMEQNSATDKDFTAPCHFNQTHLGHHFPLPFLPSLSFLFSKNTLWWQTRYSEGISCKWHTPQTNVMGSSPDGKKHSLFQRKKKKWPWKARKSDLGARWWELIEHLWEKEGHLSQLLFSSAKWFYWWVIKGFLSTFSLKVVL